MQNMEPLPFHIKKIIYLNRLIEQCPMALGVGLMQGPARLPLVSCLW